MSAAEPAHPLTVGHGGPTLLTVGHSNHELPAFVALLEQFCVTAVADVRSAPYSKYTPQFNRDVLQTALPARQIAYVFLGRELGARRSERECYVGGVARYERVAATQAFAAGLDRLRNGLETQRLALLCAEKDPLTCHRMILVTRRMRGSGLRIEHIREDGTLETNDQAEERLLRLFHPDGVDLFRSRAELVEDAYDQQGSLIAYRESDAAEAGAA
jgi:uncharacterized protein (DUF488 family)